MKVASVQDMDALMKDAAAHQWSAEGRPSWFREHRGQFATAVLVTFGAEGPGVHRCIATIILNDRSGGRFTLDVAKDNFDGLADLDDRSLVVMAHRYLAKFAPVELDEDQADTWEGSVWKRWGEV
jgi:hypothetical protein